MKKYTKTIFIVFYVFLSPAIVFGQNENSNQIILDIISTMQEEINTFKSENERLKDENNDLIKRVEALENIKFDVPSIKEELKEVDLSIESINRVEDESIVISTLKNSNNNDISSEPTKKQIETMENTTNIKSTDLDFSIPESPAFAVLGLSPQEVIRPGSPRSFATELLNGIDRNGNFQSGVAIDTAPYLLFLGNSLSIGKYREKSFSGYISRLLTRTQFSFGTAKGSSEDDKSVKLATGFRITPFDLGDPRMDSELTKCFAEASLNTREAIIIEQKLILETNEEKRDELEREIEKLLKPKADMCRRMSRKRLWNSSAWSIGIAPSWISTTGNADDLEWNGYGLWTTVGYGFENLPVLEDTSQLLLSARYNQNQEVPIEGMDGLFLEQDSLFLGTRLLIGVPTVIAQFEGGWMYEDPDNRNSTSSWIFSTGGSIKIVENLWLELSIGGRTSGSNTDSQVFLLNSLKWGFQGSNTIGKISEN